jgi:hypothetical protein
MTAIHPQINHSFLFPNHSLVGVVAGRKAGIIPLDDRGQLVREAAVRHQRVLALQGTSVLEERTFFWKWVKIL